MESDKGELNIGRLSKTQVESFFKKMYDQGFTMHCEQYEWIPKDYTEVSVIMYSRDRERVLYFFCLTDGNWILCSDYTHSFSQSKVLRYA